VTESWLEEHRDAQLMVENQIATSLFISPINLAQVILNLLDNAYEANPKGKIIFNLREIHNSIELTLDDEGPGFSERVLSRQGEPFVTTKSNGTGLGLYVSEIFVQSLGGNMTISNKANSSGALVTLNWPSQKETSKLGDV